MKHQRDWTVQALANRADSISRPGSVSDVMGGDDHRDVAVFYAHELADFIDERCTCFVALSAEIIGVVIGGDDLVARWEAIETEKLQ